MNLLKNSSVAFAVSVAELTWFYTQAAEETSRGIEIFVGVTIVYAFSAFVVNRIMAFVEKRIQIPGFVVASGAGGGH
jgi:glutamate/aspartate transport system permease protein